MMIEGDRAAVEIEMHCRHRETRNVVKATKANFWTLESGWPVSLTEYYVVRPFQDLMTMVVERNALASNRP